MEKYGLDLHGEMLLEEYRQQYHLFEQLNKVVMDSLNSMVKKSDIELNSMESRIKKEDSLVGKLKRKGSKYQTLMDITDIFGARIIAFYNEDVDRIASMAEQLFEIDWPNSVDKRKMHEFDSFGYNSLHYICSIPKSLFGYKSEIETPLEYHRNLSRLAGMLELADNEFSRIRNSISDYRRRAQSLVQAGHLEEVLLDGDTFRSYLSQRPFDKLNHKIAAITKAEIHEASLRPYLKVLRILGMKTLGDVERMMNECSEAAYQLALYQLGSTDIDIVSETIGLQNLCIVYILKNGGGKMGLVYLFNQINGEKPENEMMASFVW